MCERHVDLYKYAIAMATWVCSTFNQKSSLDVIDESHESLPSVNMMAFVCDALMERSDGIDCHCL